MDNLSKQLYACVSKAVEEFISKASNELDIDKSKLLNIWNNSASNELKVVSVSSPKRTSKTVSDTGAKQCIHIATRGKTKGEQCNSKASPDSSKGYCKKHSKTENSGSREKKSTPVKSVASSSTDNKTLATPAVNTIKVDSLPIKINKFGNYQNSNGILFDRTTHEAYGRQSSDGKTLPLTADDIRECKQQGYKYRMPEQLKNKDDENEEENEEVEEVEEEEDEEVEEVEEDDE